MLPMRSEPGGPQARDASRASFWRFFYPLPPVLDELKGPDASFSPHLTTRCRDVVAGQRLTSARQR